VKKSLPRPYIVAELSANHDGSLERALATIDACAAAGVNAVKFQTWSPGMMVLDPRHVIEDGPWKGMNLAQLYERAHTPWEWHRELFARARGHGIDAFSTVFDIESLTFLEELECPRYKIASFELVDLTLITATAKTGKPMILSTGMATEPEIREAMQAARYGGAKDLTLLKCTSAYPADPEHVNLAAMAGLAHRHDARPGLSDHTQGIGVAIAASALGAAMIEKHVKLNDGSGLDDAFSITTQALATMVEECRRVAKVRGEDVTGPSADEEPQRALRRSLYFARTMRAGERIGYGDVRSARPAAGLACRFHGQVMGATVLKDAPAGTPVTWDHVQAPSLSRAAAGL